MIIAACNVLTVFFFLFCYAGIVMVNKDTIDVVETAFQHFHRFLDTLSLNKNTSPS